MSMNKPWAAPRAIDPNRRQITAPGHHPPEELPTISGRSRPGLHERKADLRTRITAADKTGVDLPDVQISAATGSRGGLRRNEAPSVCRVSQRAGNHSPLCAAVTARTTPSISGLYPLGSCTMKHNPRLNEKMARLPGFHRPASAGSRSPPRFKARSGVMDFAADELADHADGHACRRACHAKGGCAWRAVRTAGYSCRASRRAAKIARCVLAAGPLPMAPIPPRRPLPASRSMKCAALTQWPRRAMLTLPTLESQAWVPMWRPSC